MPSLSRHHLAAIVSLTASFATQAAILTSSGYNYIGSSPSGSYPDSSGLELIDGVANNIAWGGGNTISYGDVGALAGWDGYAPTIRFNFAQSVNLTGVTVWAADSDGSAAVYLPSQITLSTTGGFSQSFSVTNPVGAGATVPITLSGFSVSSDNLTVTVTPHPADRWTMLSEVIFTGNIPESSQSAAMAGLGALAIVYLRHRRGTGARV